MYKITVLFLAVNFMVEAANWKDICTKNNCGKCSKIIVKGKGDKSKIRKYVDFLVKIVSVCDFFDRIPILELSSAVSKPHDCSFLKVVT